MSNTTDETTWAARARLVFLEQQLWWSGEVRRSDLTGKFGISPAQASSDISRYMELNPTAAAYNTRGKRYEGLEGMVCILHEPTLEDLLHLEQGHPPTVRQKTPSWTHRVATNDVERKLVIATRAGLQVRISLTVPGNQLADRDILPSGVEVCDGRWYVRAWSVGGDYWTNYAIGRIAAANWPQETTITPPADPDWDVWVRVVVQLVKGLDVHEYQRLHADYNLTDGKMSMVCRRALGQEVLDRLPRGFEFLG